MSSSGNTEELGIRLRADGVPETTNGLALTGQAMEGLGKKADAAAPPLARVGKTAKETQAAMRLLPAQITDVVTSLASGQPAWLVAIQQGGQLKDSFGGIGPMWKAITATATPLRVGVLGVGSAFGVLVLAHQQGQREAQAHARALIMTQNAAGTSADAIATMARNVSNVAGTRGKASEALSALAATGEVAARNLERFAAVAVSMERELDEPLTDTARKFAELGRTPLEASVRLNRGLNYLTASVYDQIRALQAEGRVVEAGALAQQAYADAMASHATAVGANLGLLERGWRGAGDVAKWAWDQMLNVGREDTLQERLDAINKILNGKKGWGRLGGPLGDQAQRENESTFGPQRDAINRSMLNAVEQGMQASGAVEQAQRELRQREAGFVEAQNAVSVASARAAATQRESLAAVELARAQASASARETLVKREMATLESLRERDAASTADYYERKRDLEVKALQSQIGVVDQQLTAEQRMLQVRKTLVDAQIEAEQRRKPETDIQSSQQQARLIELNAQKTELQLQSEQRLIELRARRRDLTAQQSAAEVEALRNIERASAGATDRFLDDVNQRRAALAQFSEQLRAGNAAQRVDLIADPYARTVARSKLDIAELERMHRDYVSGLKARMAALELIQPEAAEAVRQEIQETEQRKADAIVLINRRLAEDLKPEWQRMLESWQDHTRLMREAYDDFQTGWLRSGEDAWVQYMRTGKLSLTSLKDFAMGEAGKLFFRQSGAPLMSQIGSGLANLLGITGGDGSAAGAATEIATRTALNASLNIGAMSVNNLATAAANAAAALAAMAGSGGGGGSGSGWLSLVSNIFSGGMSVDTGGYGMTPADGSVVLPTRGGAAFGGAVKRGSVLEVNERGPELLSTGGKTFLMMGANDGYVTPNGGAAPASGGNRTVNLSFSPVVHIDSRTDRAEVAALVSRSLESSKAELLEMMDRGMV